MVKETAQPTYCNCGGCNRPVRLKDVTFSEGVDSAVETYECADGHRFSVDPMGAL